MALGRTHRLVECKWWKGFFWSCIGYVLSVSQTCKHVVWFNCNVHYRANWNYQTSNIFTHIQVQTSSHSSVNPWKTWIYKMPTVCKIWDSLSGPDEDSVSLVYALSEVEAAQFPELVVPVFQLPRCFIPEGWDLWQ